MLLRDILICLLSMLQHRHPAYEFNMCEHITSLAAILGAVRIGDQRDSTSQSLHRALVDPRSPDNETILQLAYRPALWLALYCSVQGSDSQHFLTA